MTAKMMRVALACLAGLASTMPVSAQVPLGALDGIVGNHRTVIFGEDSHGMAAVHAAVPPMFEHLVTAKGFRVFVFEVQWNVTDAFKDFMASDRTSLNTIEQFYLDGAFVSADTAAMLVWIRNWNRAHPTDTIGIYGYQPEQPVTDSGALAAFLDRRGGAGAARLRGGLETCKALNPSFKTDLDMVIANGALNKAGKPSYTDAERDACLAAVDAITAYLDKNAAVLARQVSREDRVLARLHAISLRAYVDVLRRLVDGYVLKPDQPLDEQLAGQGKIYNDGDAARFRILTDLRALYFPGKKAFFWMHDWHAARHASEMDALPGESGIPRGTISIGERIAGAAPRDTVVIGNLVPCGKRCTEPAGSVEPAFAQRYGDRTALVDLHDRRQVAGLPVGVTGTFYANQNKIGFADVILARQFDAILYVPKSDPVH